MTKLKVQAQHLQPGDIVGSGEDVCQIQVNGINIPIGKVFVGLNKNGRFRSSFWGKYTMINVERPDRPGEKAYAKRMIDW